MIKLGILKLVWCKGGRGGVLRKGSTWCCVELAEHTFDVRHAFAANAVVVVAGCIDCSRFVVAVGVDDRNLWADGAEAFGADLVADAIVVIELEHTVVVVVVVAFVRFAVLALMRTVEDEVDNE